MKLYAKPGFEAFEQGRGGHWCPVLTGRTDTTLLDCNPSTNNHGTLTGYTDLNTGWVGSQYGTVNSFNGSTNYITTNDFPLTPVRFINIWIRPAVLINSATNGQFLFQLRFSTSSQFYFALSLGAITGLITGEYINISDPASPGLTIIGVTDGGSLPANEWSMISAIWDGSFYGFFVNGIRRSTTFANGSKLGTANRMILGCVNGDGAGPRGFFNGQVAESFYSAVSPSNDAILRNAFQAGPGGMWQPYPRRTRSYFAQVLTTYRNRSSRYLCFPG